MVEIVRPELETRLRLTDPQTVIHPSNRARSVWAPWHPLRECVVGSCLNQHYFDEVRDPAVRDPLNRMLAETQEDLDQLANLLTSMGVEVIRPTQDTDLRLNIDQKQTFIQPVEIAPRDLAVQLGPHTVYRSVRDRGCVGAWLQPSDIMMIESAWFELLQIAMRPEPAGWTLVGNRLIVDTFQMIAPQSRPELEAWCKRWLPGVDLVLIDAGCHTDSWFQCVAPGVLLTCSTNEDLPIFQSTFKGWEIKQVEGNDSLKKPFMDAMRSEENSYWLPGEENNLEMQKFIRDCLYTWTGNSQETVWEINSLMVDEHTIISCVDNVEVRSWLKSLGIEMVVQPLRHRWFWDGGISCFTLPTHREGEQENFLNF